MKLLRTVVLGALAWVLVVAAGSTLVWTVISRAGDEVVSAREPVPGPTRSTLTKPSAATSASDPAGRPSRHPSSPASPASPSGPSGPSGPSSPSSPVSPVSPTSGPVSASGPTGPKAERRTWQGPGGLVVAECRGATVSLVAAQPETGYAVDVGERGPEKLEVEFEGREDDAGRHSHVVARCVGGVPQFSAVSEDSGGGGDG